jgi:hypothetical protein
MISDRTALTPQEVRNVLDALVESEAVTMVGAGRSRLYCIGPHPIMVAVRAVFAAEENLYAELMDELRTCLSARREVFAAWVYGSVARGEDGPSSDVDIVIVASDPDVEGVANDVRSAFTRHSSRSSLPLSIVCLGVSDVIRLSTGDPWWVRLSQDDLSLKGSHPASFAGRYPFLTKLEQRRSSVPPSKSCATQVGTGSRSMPLSISFGRRTSHMPAPRATGT